MMKIFGILLIVVGVWVGLTIYTEGSDAAFGGLFAGEKIEGESDDGRPLPARVKEQVTGAYQLQEERRAEHPRLIGGPLLRSEQPRRLHQEDRPPVGRERPAGGNAQTGQQRRHRLHEDLLLAEEAIEAKRGPLALELGQQHQRARALRAPATPRAAPTARAAAAGSRRRGRRLPGPRARSPSSRSRRCVRCDRSGSPRSARRHRSGPPAAPLPRAAREAPPWCPPPGSESQGPPRRRERRPWRGPRRDRRRGPPPPTRCPPSRDPAGRPAAPRRPAADRLRDRPPACRPPPPARARRRRRCRRRRRTRRSPRRRGRGAPRSARRPVSGFPRRLRSDGGSIPWATALRTRWSSGSASRSRMERSSSSATPTRSSETCLSERDAQLPHQPGQLLGDAQQRRRPQLERATLEIAQHAIHAIEARSDSRRIRFQTIARCGAQLARSQGHLAHAREQAVERLGPHAKRRRRREASDQIVCGRSSGVFF